MHLYMHIKYYTVYADIAHTITDEEASQIK